MMDTPSSCVLQCFWRNKFTGVFYPFTQKKNLRFAFYGFETSYISLDNIIKSQYLLSKLMNRLRGGGISAHRWLNLMLGSLDYMHVSNLVSKC